MKKNTTGPQRWRDHRGADPVEKQLAGLFARVGPSPRLTAEALQRVLRTLRDTYVVKPRPYRRLIPVFAALTTSALVAAAVATGLHRDPPTCTTLKHLVRPSLPAAEAPSIGPAPELAEPVGPTLAVIRKPALRRSNPSPQQQSLAGESALLARAFRNLEVQHDPQGALRILDEVRMQFPDPQLPNEALLARTGAIMALGRHDEALETLTAEPPWTRTSHRGLATIRGELRARHGDCSGANADFSFVLNSNMADGLTERSLKGRAYCHAGTSDPAAARADLESYLRLFPSGRFADEIRKVLNHAL